MGEIKFRAWDDTKLVYDSAYNDTKYKRYNLGEFFRELEDKYPLMQYTGLKDKNGKDIYEGDIIQNYKGAYKVFWDKHYAKFNLSGLGVFPSSASTVKFWKIIGNIYENGDLL